MEQALETSVVRVRGEVVSAARDRVAIERPLQIRVRVGGAEGVLAGAGALLGAEPIGDDCVRIDLAPSAADALAASTRAFVTSAACGVCGRADLDGLAAGRVAPPDDGARVAVAVVHALPSALRGAQATFDRTGGLHAAALFSLAGDRLAAAEDVGRHNAVDKLVGRLLLAGQLPARAAVL